MREKGGNSDFARAATKQLQRRFAETSGTVEIEAERIVAAFDKRSRSPILR
jgi:hypothetical protein